MSKSFAPPNVGNPFATPQGYQPVRNLSGLHNVRSAYANLDWDLKDPKGQPARHRAFMAMTYSLVQSYWSNGKLPDRGPADAARFAGGNNIGAILVGDKTVVAWGVNTKTVNSTYHGETLMLQNLVEAYPDWTLEKWHEQSRDLTLYTTLEPCHMCGGFIRYLLPHAKVVIGQLDVTIEKMTTSFLKEAPCQLDYDCARDQMNDLDSRFANSEFKARNDIIGFLKDESARNFYNSQRALLRDSATTDSPTVETNLYKFSEHQLRRILEGVNAGITG
jgi:tRNA(Arg) A34 adenosine deaminase TadA